MIQGDFDITIIILGNKFTLHMVIWCSPLCKYIGPIGDTTGPTELGDGGCMKCIRFALGNTEQRTRKSPSFTLKWSALPVDWNNTMNVSLKAFLQTFKCPHTQRQTTERFPSKLLNLYQHALLNHKLQFTLISIIHYNVTQYILYLNYIAETLTSW
jgi:hypothetical protein